ncbi:MAG: hypothetical protein DSZ03_00785 [Sulfurimonas sp.]|nr:MAG: hypothetical protein DSZ03_00785 [Sulfurimonas sp.]
MINPEELYRISSAKSILFVEDDSILRQSAEIMFKELFALVDTAGDGKSALLAYHDYYNKHRHYYDIVITDIKMPRMSGIELTSELYKIHKDQSIIVISAHDDSEYLIELINLGVSSFIQKPFSTQNMIDKIYDVCLNLDNHHDNQRNISINGNYVWCHDAKCMLHDNQEIKLTKNEKRLLYLLFSDPLMTFKSHELFEFINSDTEEEFNANSLKSLIKRLRKKIPANLIENIYAEGYKINSDLL